jgi:hypothetical protein
MKTLNAASLAIQKKIGQVQEPIEKLILYEQWDGEIIEYISANSVKLADKFDGWYTTGELIFCPLKDFDTEVPITVIIETSTTTTITTTGITWTAADVGRTIARRINVTRKIAHEGIGDTVQALEGQELLEYDSGKLDVVFDNTGGYFHSGDETGLLNSGRVFWAKYEIGFKGANDNQLYFAGLVDLTDVDPDLFNRTIKVRIYGHMKELERYPAFYVSDDSIDEFTKISGITMLEFDESDESEEGIKSVEYRPFTNSRMKGLSVESVSDDTVIGIKVLSFKFPFEFRWDNGAWTTVDEISDMDANGNVRLYAKGGSGDSLFAMINFGSGNGGSDTLNEFPDSDDEIWVNIKDTGEWKDNREIAEYGKPILKFDN